MKAPKQPVFRSGLKVTFQSLKLQKTGEFNLLDTVSNNPYRVRDVPLSDYAGGGKVKLREENRVVLYKKSQCQSWDCLLMCPNTPTMTLRLFQVVSEDDAMNWFSQYALKLQLFYDTLPLKAESIQPIVNCIRSHPDWSCAHIAVKTGLRKFLKYTHINSQNEVGQTPLHLACERGDLASVKQLLDESQVRTDISDFYGDTPIHCACKHRFSVFVKALCSQLGIGVNDLNIYFCFEAHKQLDMWLIFVSQVAVLRFLCQMCRLLLERDCSVNVLNKTGQSPLHILTKQGRSKAALVLLTHGADANLKDQDGNTALHLAMKMNHMDLIKVLIVFWADVEIPNNLGETPGLIAAQTSKGPKREMLLDMLSSVGVQRFLPAFPESSPPMSSTTKPQGIGNVIVSHHGMDKLLCLDGGGIKGLVLIQMLIALEQEAGQPIRELFDWVAGTSTGGILALCIIHGKPLNDLQNLYFKMRKKVFKGWRPYTKKPLEKFLKKEFGEDTKMTDVSHPRVMVTSVLADRRPCKLHIFRNYEPPYSTSDTFRPLTIPQDQLVWKAARASGAAPTYFPPMGRFLDGGLLANNPTLDAMAEIHQYNKTLNAEGKDTKKLGMVLSLGTGKSPEVEVTSLKLSCNPVKLAKSLKAANNLLKILMDCCTDSDGCAVDRARAFCEMTDTLYRRLSPQLSVEVMLNEVDEDVLMNMLLETRTYLNEQRAVLQFVARFLRDH
uniref:phospholipase A2 n=1 Tax=Gouania willdenowi TaxID=441366 RepID=A0A8C5D2J2_GOUWI